MPSTISDGSAAVPERRLVKTGKSSNDPYVHTIDSVMHEDLGKYVCVIANVIGERECSAYVTIRNGVNRVSSESLFGVVILAFGVSLIRRYWKIWKAFVFIKL